MLKKVLLFSCEPGGAEVIIPVARLLAGTGEYDVTVTGYGYAIERFEKQGVPYIRVEPIEKDDSYFLSRFAPDLVITSATSLPVKDMSEKHIWRLARQAGVKSIALLDQWQNYSIRFSGVTTQERLAYLPDAINCIDEIGKKEMIAEGFDGEILHPLGQPYLDRLADVVREIDCAAIRNKLKVAQDGHIVLFVSEAIEENFGSARGYTQYDALRIFLKNVGASDDRKILIKLHPKDDIAKFNQIQAEFPQHALLFISSELTALECIAVSDSVFGMTSIMLIEAYILGKPVVSIQPGLKIADPLILSRYGYVKAMCDSTFELDMASTAVSAGRQELGYKFLDGQFLSLVKELAHSSPNRKS